MKLLQTFTAYINRLFAEMDAQDLIPHPVKRLARRCLGAGVLLSVLLHFTAIGGVLLYRYLSAPSVVNVRIVPYPTNLFDMLDPSTIVTSEYGGGGGGRQAGGEPPPDPGDDIQNKGKIVPIPVKIGIPEPVPDTEIAEEMTLATQDEMQQEMVVSDEIEETEEDRGLEGEGGGGTGEGGLGGAFGSGGGGGGDGPPGTWRYDTPPNPRRLITAVQPKNLRNVEGTVKFRLLIDEFGKVADANIMESSGYEELDDLALSAINKSTFNPATLQGRTVKAWITFGYGFRVRKR